MNRFDAFFVSVFVVAALVWGGRADAYSNPLSCESLAATYGSDFRYFAAPGTGCNASEPVCSTEVWVPDYDDPGASYWAPSTPCWLDEEGLGGGGDPPPSSCSSRTGQVASSGVYDMGTSDSNDPPHLACLDGCEVSYTGTGISWRRPVAGVFHYGAEGMYVFTGAGCSSFTAPPSASASPPEASCDLSKQIEKSIEGAVVCFPIAGSKSEKTTDPVTGATVETITVTGSGGGTTSTVITTGPDGTTTTTTTSSGGGGGGAQPGSFCARYPDDPSCVAGGVGDDPLGGDCALNPYSLGCASLSGSVPEEAVSTSARDISALSPVQIGGPGECPAPLTATVAGMHVELPFDLLCEYATTLRPLVLALAWLSAGILFIGGVRGS